MLLPGQRNQLDSLEPETEDRDLLSFVSDLIRFEIHSCFRRRSYFQIARQVAGAKISCGSPDGARDGRRGMAAIRQAMPRPSTSRAAQPTKTMIGAGRS
jgi:hypothetical protein